MDQKRKNYTRQLILISTENLAKNFLWVDVGLDGSFYLGIGDPNKNYLISSQVSNSNKVLYKDFKDDVVLNSPKISFHPENNKNLSGRIHIRGYSDSNTNTKTSPEIISDWEIGKNLQRPKQIANFVFDSSKLETSKNNIFVPSSKDIIIFLENFGAQKFGGAIIAIPKNFSRGDIPKLIKNTVACAIFSGNIFDIAIIVHRVEIKDENFPYHLILMVPTTEVFY